MFIFRCAFFMELFDDLNEAFDTTDGFLESLGRGISSAAGATRLSIELDVLALLSDTCRDADGDSSIDGAGMCICPRTSLDRGENRLEVKVSRLNFDDADALVLSPTLDDCGASFFAELPRRDTAGVALGEFGIESPASDVARESFSSASASRAEFCICRSTISKFASVMSNPTLEDEDVSCTLSVSSASGTDDSFGVGAGGSSTTSIT